MRLVLTRPATADLRDIGRWIARDNPFRSISFVQELRVAGLDLLMFPQAYPVDPRYLPSEIHRRAHGSYVIFYRIEADRLLIVGILHAARDAEAILRPRIV